VEQIEIEGGWNELVAGWSVGQCFNGRDKSRLQCVVQALNAGFRTVLMFANLRSGVRQGK